MIKLYGHASRTAANVLSTRAALAEAGVEYGYVALDLSKGDQRQPEFLAINPHGKVPALVDGDFSRWQSPTRSFGALPRFFRPPPRCRRRARVRAIVDAVVRLRLHRSLHGFGTTFMFTPHRPSRRTVRPSSPSEAA